MEILDRKVAEELHGSDYYIRIILLPCFFQPYSTITLNFVEKLFHGTLKQLIANFINPKERPAWRK